WMPGQFPACRTGIIPRIKRQSHCKTRHGGLAGNRRSPPSARERCYRHYPFPQRKNGAAAAIAVRLAGKGGFVATQHFLEPNRLTRRGIGRTVSDLTHRWVNGRVDRVIAISQASREHMISRGDAVNGKIRVIANGISDPRRAV